MTVDPFTLRGDDRRRAPATPTDRRHLAVYPIPSQGPGRLGQRRVSRPRLASALRSSHEPVIVIQAPIGYGKNALIDEWAKQDGRRFARISFEKGLCDPLVVAAQLLIALDVHTAERERLLANAANDPAFFSAVTLQRITDIWAATQQPRILVVEGMHHVDSPEVLRLVTRLGEQPPPGSRVVFSGRMPMQLPLARWLAAEHALWLGQDELAMTPDEESAALARFDLRLDDEQRALFHERTQGWPACVFLAGKHLRDAADIASALSELAGGDEPIARYIWEQVLDPLPRHLVRCLEECSSVQVLVADVCNAIRGVGDSGNCLRELVRFGVPEAAPAHRGTKEGFICHPLLREALAAHLHAYEPAVERRSHERAARWLGQQHRFFEAIPHAMAAGFTGLATELMWKWAPEALACGQRRLVENSLRRFSEQQLIARPELSMTMAYCAMQAGRSAVPWLSSAEQALTTSVTPARPSSLRTALSLAKAVLMATDDQEMLAHARNAYENSAADDPWRSFAGYGYATAQHYADDPASALTLLDEAERLSRILGQSTVNALCNSRLSLLAADRGDWGRSATLAERALRVIIDADLAEIATMVPVFLTAALNRAHERTPEEAVKLARRGTRLLSYTAPRMATLSVEGNALLGRLYLMLGDSSAARVALAEAQTALSQRFDAPLLRRYLDEGWSLAASSPLSGHAGPSAITTAELRVLHLLPTHLSFDEIGRALYLSRNTVKTQAISVYRKLGVRSRSEAVQAARRLGLISRG